MNTSLPPYCDLRRCRSSGGCWMRGQLVCSLVLAAIVLAGCTTATASPTTLTAVPSLSLPATSTPAANVAAASSTASRRLVLTTSSSTPAMTIAVVRSTGSSMIRSTDPKTRTSVTSSPTSAPPVATLPPVASSGLAASEVADRAAIQRVWVEYWITSQATTRTPTAERRAALEKVAVEPQITGLLNEAADWDKKGWTSYGIPGHRPYWGPPVDQANTAIMGDCMDLSSSGHMQVKTGTKLTVGKNRVNIRGLFRREFDGKWKVYGFEDLRDLTC